MMQQRRTQARPMIIRVIKATDLPVADWDNNLADPYVAITVLKVRAASRAGSRPTTH